MLQKALPDWLDKQEYPFQSRYFSLPMGTMHYVDEGGGDAVVFVHGNGSWSFTFRHLIKVLRNTCRCIALDLIGFGLSDKPADWDYLPASHARNLELFLDSLALPTCILVLCDWGVSIGLSYTLSHPHKIQKLLLLNAWCKPLPANTNYDKGALLSGYRNNWLLKPAFLFFKSRLRRQLTGNAPRFSKLVYRHYYQPLQRWKDRKGYRVFLQQLYHSNGWAEELWKQQHQLRAFPLTIIAGMNDLHLEEKVLNQWQITFPYATIVRVKGAAYLLSECVPEVILKELTVPKNIIQYQLQSGGVWKEK